MNFIKRHLFPLYVAFVTSATLILAIIEQVGR